MTAHDLVESIFARAQAGAPGNVRFVSVDQLCYLLDLIAQHPEGGALVNGSNGRMLWTPSGPHKYEIEGDKHSPRRKLTRMANTDAGSAGSLFE